MHFKSVAVVSALAFAASAAAVAEPDAERPRIYYPRQIKREFSNSTITSTEPASSSNKATTTTSKGTTSRRGDLTDLISDLVGSKPDSSTTTQETATVTTVVVQNTIVVTPTPEKSTTQGTGGATAITIQPTTKTQPTSKPGSSTDKGESSTESGILIAPTGIVSSSKEQSTATSDEGSVPTSPVNNSTSADAQQSSTSTAAQQSSTSTAAQQSSTSTATSTSGLLDPIESLLSSLLPDPTSTNSTALPPQTSTPAVSTTTVPTASLTSTSASSTAIVILPSLTLSESIFTTTSSPPVSSSEAANPTSTIQPSVTSSASVSSLPPASVTTDLPIITSTSSDVPVVNSTSSISISATNGPTSVSTLTGTSTGSATETSTASASETLTGHPTGSSTATSSVPTDVPVTNVTSSAPPTAPVTTTSLPITSSAAAENSTVAVPTTAPSTALPTTTASASGTDVSVTSVQPVTSIRPTATVSNTENWLPTTIVIEPTTMSFSIPTQSPTGTSSKALPTGLPKLILPDDPNKPVPENTVPIQIGFLFPLNYAFVASNTVAASQIFKFLPQALADAGGFSLDIVQVSKLVPDDTRDKWGYVTTIAKLNYPQNLVDKLQMDLWSPNSGIYNNADGIVRNLTALINPKIDIHGNIADGGAAPPTGGAVPTSGPGSSNDPFNNNNNQQGDQSSKQKATTAGIAMGAVGLSVMYGAAMFIVARRYKRKRQTHRRSSSVTNSQGSSEMRYNGAGSPALMGGALLSRDFSNYGGAVAGGRDSHGSGRSGAGNSGRTANISAPVAAENSLGWN